MMAFDWTPRSVAKLEDEDQHTLAELLIDGVDGDASVSFLHPLSLPSGLAFQSGVDARRPAQHHDLIQGSTSTAIKLASRIRP